MSCGHLGSTTWRLPSRTHQPGEEPTAVILLGALLSFQFKTSDEVMGSAESCNTGFCAIELIARK